WKDPNRDCLEVGAPARPLVVYFPPGIVLGGMTFVAESSLSEIDDALVVERSNDLTAWQRVSHDPILSSTLVDYVLRPTSELWSNVGLVRGTGSFLRVSSASRRLRFCALWFRSSDARRIASVPKRALHLHAS